MNKKLIIGIAVLGVLIVINVLVRGSRDSEGSYVQTSQVADVVLPEEVINSFPTFPEAVVANVSESKSDDKTSYSVRLEADSGVSEINEWYREALSTNGWSIKSDRNVGGYQIIQAEKDNLFTSMQTAKGESENTVIISQQIQVRSQ